MKWLGARTNAAVIGTVSFHALLLLLFALSSKAEARAQMQPSAARLTPPVTITVPPEPEVLPEPTALPSEAVRERNRFEGSCGWSCASGGQDYPQLDTALGLSLIAGSCSPAVPAHRVEPGETLTSIAHDYGFDDFHAIYNKEVNFHLYYARPDPNVIMVDDVVLIPAPKGHRYCEP